MKPLLKLDLNSRKVCFIIETEKCCGELITDLNRFLVKVKKQSKLTSDTLVTYPFFDIREDGAMCLLLDDNMKDIKPGRYIFEIVLDNCKVVSEIKFKWGSTIVVTDIDVESSNQGDCYDETGSLINNSLPVPVTTDCDEETEQDPCSPGCDPCSKTSSEFYDPNDLLERDC